MVPSKAVIAGQQGAYVFVVKSDRTTEVRNVRVARAAGDMTVLDGGLKPGERVVTDGQLRLSAGAKVEVEEAAPRHMNFSGLFIRRPVMTTLVMVGILLFGVLGYRALPVSDLPNVDFPTITVSAVLPGASPETMASAVATPLEKQFSTIAGLDVDDLDQQPGHDQITLQFALDRDIDAAAQDVQAAIAADAARAAAGMHAAVATRR